MTFCSWDLAMARSTMRQISLRWTSKIRLEEMSLLCQKVLAVPRVAGSLLAFPLTIQEYGYPVFQSAQLILDDSLSYCVACQRRPGDAICRASAWYPRSCWCNVPMGQQLCEMAKLSGYIQAFRDRFGHLIESFWFGRKLGYPAVGIGVRIIGFRVGLDIGKTVLYSPSNWQIEHPTFHWLSSSARLPRLLSNPEDLLEEC